MNCKYVKSLMPRLGFPERSAEYLSEQCKRLKEGYEDYIDSRVKYLEGEDNDKLNEVQIQLKLIAEKMGIHSYTLDLIYMLLGCESLEKRYKAAGYSEELFIDTMKDLTYKLKECEEVEGVIGIFTFGWFYDYYRLKRFYLGRFQFEFKPFLSKIYSVNGYTVKEGEQVLNIHIPSNGISLTDEVRMSAYKAAYEFYKNDFPGGYIPMVCSSWLLFSENDVIFPENSNMLKFKQDFAILNSVEWEGFAHKWRVFGCRDENTPYEELPENNSLQRSMKKWIVSGKKHGGGYGVFFFDGEKIVK